MNITTTVTAGLQQSSSKTIGVALQKFVHDYDDDDGFEGEFVINTAVWTNHAEGRQALCKPKQCTLSLR